MVYIRKTVSGRNSTSTGSSLSHASGHLAVTVTAKAETANGRGKSDLPRESVGQVGVEMLASVYYELADVLALDD
jgi:hypothetical protein